MRWIGCLTLLTMVAVATSQDWQPQGQIDSREIKIERREGNVVKGTEFVHYEYRVSIRAVPAQDATDIPIWCDASCKGKKHKEHSECDLSCDDRCSKRHFVKLQGYVKKLRDNMKEMTKTSAMKARGIGMPGGPDNWSSTTSNALKAMEAAAKADKAEFDPGHWELPCALTERWYGYSVQDIFVKGEFWKVGYYMTGGVKTPVNEKVDGQEGHVMTVYKTKQDPIVKGSNASCKCTADPVVPPPIGVIGRTPTFSGLGWRKPDGTVVIPDDKKVKVTCTGKGLTKAEIHVDNKTGEAYEVIIQPGTKLVPEDSGTQVMGCIGNQQMMVAAKGTTVFQVSIKPEPVHYREPQNRQAEFLTLLGIAPVFQVGELRVACTEMTKKEPSEKSNFKIVAPNDPMLKRICAIEDRGFMQAAIAQGRVWIYTDGASREQINKRLLPGLTDGMYLNALHGLARAGVDMTQARYKPLLDPTLLAAPTASQDATMWFADFLRTQDPKMSFAKKAIDAAKQGMAAKAEPLDARHAGYLVLALSDSDNKEVRTQLLEFIDKAIPETLRAEFLTEGGLGAMLSIATFGDDSEALRVFGLAKKFGGPDCRAMLESFAFFGRESIRTAAEEALKGS